MNRFPVPYGILEDNFSVVGWQCSSSYEYGNAACNVQGKSQSPAPSDWETSLGAFEENAQNLCPTICFAFVGNGLTRGDGSDTDPCDQIAGVHCYVLGLGGVVDDQDALDNLCSAADSSGHLRGLEAEEIVFLKGSPTPSPSPTSGNNPVYADTQTLVYMINTMSHLVQDTTGGCKNVVAIDIEAGGGSFYPLDGYAVGTVAGGIPVRLEAAAMRFLVPNPSTQVPDRMQPLFYTIGGTNNALELTRFRGHFRSYSEGVHHGKAPNVPAGVSA